MSTSALGFDSFGPVTGAMVADVQAQCGQVPRFCGRYFSGVDFDGGGEYTHATQSAVLHSVASGLANWSLYHTGGRVYRPRAPGRQRPGGRFHGKPGG